MLQDKFILLVLRHLTQRCGIRAVYISPQGGVLGHMSQVGLGNAVQALMAWKGRNERHSHFAPAAEYQVPGNSPLFMMSSQPYSNIGDKIFSRREVLRIFLSFASSDQGVAATWRAN